jgi:hypothetical protein
VFCLFILAGADVPLQPFPCSKALLHVPSRAQDPYLDDGAAPASVMQLYFDTLPALEGTASRMPRGVAEAMAVHRFPVPDPSIRNPCTYLVTYEGPAEDEAAWHAEYFAHHPRLMAALPGIRDLEIYLPVNWRCPARLERVRSLQRNKVAFDSAEALTAALGSPVRKEMRRHYNALPPFSGRVTHYAMTTSVLR